MRPSSCARAHAKDTILVDQGTSDAFLARELRPELFVEACDASGQSLSLRTHEGYDHGYYFVATFVEEHLRHHARVLLGVKRRDQARHASFV